MNQIYNFSAGPAMLPKEVMLIAQKEFLNWKNLGVSILEMSHRSEEFFNMTKKSIKILRKILNVPHSYEILFCHGGARGQFSAIPLNLIDKVTKADYINTGFWSLAAAIESKKYCNPNIINVKKIINNKVSILPIKDWLLSNNTVSYIHYCPNETIEGIAIHEEPTFTNKIVVGDFSSTILSRKINIENYSVIYAGAQKNIGPSGITLIIIKKNLLKISNIIKPPSILDYNLLSKSNSMFNTPSTFSWYLSFLVFQWIQQNGGLSHIEQENEKKSKLLYDTIDNTDFYINNISYKNRSKMNVVFNIFNTSLHKIFLKESHKIGLHSLKGHNFIGGIRASIYNAMPLKGVKKLVNFMLKFEKKYG
ncbi:phosphoserine aminotransferase [Buchnera aphidicola (Nipponaphis monzeni)]|uniref:Phosphoserine aminotransferase n=1 Tax=Buchnera aphidicola (Nipponaphis monzeni) TaxID=2495405 RepID=A0A455TAC4_9GAMM|nr:3-phosphoserine/phosphohydroxythreonine transaminase [Buchnera aphidicola]BBI01255.1 phosphoserine aminotransferase [Buchnera aphidicola (Nipponaphis monzeni)]